MKILNLISSLATKRKIHYLRKKGLKIGERTIILTKKNSFSTEPYLISIGSDCLISGECLFIPHDGGTWVPNNLNKTRFDKIAPIKIGNNVYIGIRTIVLGGVSIGDNCIIGAGSIVTKDLPSNSVACGVPARVICTLDQYISKNLPKFDNTFGFKPKDKKDYFLKKYNR